MDTLPPAQPSPPRSLDGVVPATTLSPHTHTHTPLNSPARSSLAEPGSPPPHRFRWPKRSLLLGFSIATIAILFAGGAYALFLGGTSGTNPSTSVNLQKGLVGYWPFTGNAKDSTPYSENLTIYNSVTPATGPEGLPNSAYAIGTAQPSYLGTSLAAASPLRDTGAVTVSAWIYPTGTLVNEVIVRAGANGNEDYSLFWSGQQVYIEWYDGSFHHVTSSSNAAPLNTWSHIVVTRDASNNITLYVNGVVVGSGTGTTPTVSAPNLCIGGNTGSPGQQFTGSIAQVRIYNRALNPNEVTALYHEAGNGLNIDSAEAGLVGEWKLNGNAKDSTPYSNNGTLINSPTYTTGPGGQSPGAIDQNGLNSYVSIPDTPNLEYTGGNFTASVWAEPHSTETTSGYILSKPWNGSGQYNWRIIYNPNGQISISLVGSAGATYTLYSTTDLTTNTWHHIAFTVTSAGTVTLYIDGAQNSTGNDGISSWTAPAYGNIHLPLAIGTLYPYSSGWAGNTSFSFDGNESDVRIYNQALTAAQVSNLYTSGSSQITLDIGGTNNPAQSISLTQGLVGYWPFNDNAKDSTPYSDNGAVNGATLTTDHFGTANSAYSFNGSGQYITAAAPANVMNASHTVSLWAYIRGPVSGDQYLFDTGTGNKNTIAVYNSHIRTFLTASHIIDSALVPTTNTWYNIVQVFNGSTLSLYINGSLDTSISATAATASTTLSFGEYGAGGYNLNGILDSVRIYNRALSAAEVLALYSED